MGQGEKCEGAREHSGGDRVVSTVCLRLSNVQPVDSWYGRLLSFELINLQLVLQQLDDLPLKYAPGASKLINYLPQPQSAPVQQTMKRRVGG